MAIKKYLPEEYLPEEFGVLLVAEDVVSELIYLHRRFRSPIPNAMHLLVLMLE